MLAGGINQMGQLVPSDIEQSLQLDAEGFSICFRDMAQALQKICRASHFAHRKYLQRNSQDSLLCEHRAAGCDRQQAFGIRPVCHNKNRKVEMRSLA